MLSGSVPVEVLKYSFSRLPANDRVEPRRQILDFLFQQVVHRGDRIGSRDAQPKSSRRRCCRY